MINFFWEVVEEVGYLFKREWFVVGIEFMFLVCVNYEFLSMLELGLVGWVVFNWCEVEVLFFVSMFCKVIRLGFGEDDWWKFGVVGCFNDGFFVDNCFFVVLNDFVFFNVIMFCVVCLNDCEFWDRVLCVLFLMFFCDIIVFIEDFWWVFVIWKF